MSDKTGIEWTDATWNPVTGCDEVSPGCDHCYAKTFAERWRGTPGHHFENGFDVQLRPDKLDLPLRWKKPRKVFVNSMSDLFHKDVPDEYVARVFAVMVAAAHHTFQVLTKRHARMRSLLSREPFWQAVSVELGKLWDTPPPAPLRRGVPHWIWLGVSVENQQWADIRVPALLETPAVVRFLSCEPLLGPVDLTAYLRHQCDCVGEHVRQSEHGPRPDWVIVGGESGPGARPMQSDWVRTLRDQCTSAGVAFHFKQWGAFSPTRGRVGKGAAGRELDGRTWDEWPVAS